MNSASITQAAKSAVAPAAPAVDPTRWYRLPVMWLVVLLPLVSCIGGLSLLVLANLRPDPEVHSERLEARPPAHAPGG